MHPEEFEAFEEFDACVCVVLHRQNQPDHHFVAPLTERGNKYKEERQCNQHRQTSAKHAYAVLPHELLLFRLQFLRVFFIFFPDFIDFMSPKTVNARISSVAIIMVNTMLSPVSDSKSQRIPRNAH
jgi:hypothetical protein